MFTGIVEEAGTVARVTDDEGGRRIRVETDELSGFSHGESVSVSGVCLTVEEHGKHWFSVFTASETLEKTTLDSVQEGDRVNLERALPADGRLDGHVVQGHVDTTTEVEAVEQVGEDWTFTFALPDGYEQYVAPRGSIALDGVSLTVADVDDQSGTFSVAVIPTTYELTTLADRDPGDRVNVEVDVVAKYVERLETYSSRVSGADSASGESGDASDVPPDSSVAVDSAESGLPSESPESSESSSASSSS